MMSPSLHLHDGSTTFAKAMPHPTQTLVVLRTGACLPNVIRTSSKTTDRGNKDHHIGCIQRGTRVGLAISASGVQHQQETKQVIENQSIFCGNVRVLHVKQNLCGHKLHGQCALLRTPSELEALNHH